MAIRLLTLVFPQWQGSGKRKYLYHGAAFIRDLLPEGAPYREVPVSLDDDVKLENGIWGYRQILEQMDEAGCIIDGESPEKIFLIGGDCGTEIAPITYLNKMYGGDLAVVWLDAHGDLNSPSTSASHNFHGMPLRCLLGEGEESIISSCFSTLESAQVTMVGIRDLDPPEADYIKSKQIQALTVEDIERRPGKVADMVHAMGFNNVYVHIDLDVLDSGKCPWALCLTPDGMDTPTLMTLLKDLKARTNIIGISIVELKPAENMDMQPLRELVNFCKTI